MFNTTGTTGDDGLNTGRFQMLQVAFESWALSAARLVGLSCPQQG